MFARLISFLGTINKNRYMIKSFALTDLKKRYTGSFGGLMWSVVHPLMTIFTYYIIFSFVFGRKVAADYGTDSYALWLVGGLVPWFFFNETVTRSPGALQENRSLVTKTLFPSEIIPICLLASGIINHLIGLFILLVFAVIITGGISVYFPFVLVYFFLMTLMVLGLSWMFSSLNVFVRDVGQLLKIGMNLWFYYTPIFYPIGIVPERFRIVLELNPMYHVVEGYRNSLIAGRYPDPGHVAYLALFAFCTFAAGGLLYKRLKPAFADVL
ncbi:MAG: ABC transporter permease [Nitrospirae bacterium]|nr:ABC transporter permease [Nitrospirota bacterium]MBI5694207.1 ABC transporter permease [Nitrospirota bacterium]